MIEDCLAIVMAGGQSRRMGHDKAALLIGEQTLLQRVAGTMQQVFPQVLVSVREPRSKIRLPQVCDAYPDAGPLAGTVCRTGPCHASRHPVGFCRCDRYAICQAGANRISCTTAQWISGRGACCTGTPAAPRRVLLGKLPGADSGDSSRQRETQPACCA
ncbi:MAG: NTP transferase domain-containing protein [Propionivibrio sp.]|nr:NTP transferase domain-containing protein [Propionivibrio sp.]